MKLIIEVYNEKVSFETDRDDLDTAQLLRRFSDLMVAAGYHPNSVKESLLEITEEIEPKVCTDTETGVSNCSFYSSFDDFLGKVEEADGELDDPEDDGYPMNGDLG